MSDIIFDLISGLGIGALFAMLGAGLVVSYKGSGVINFAHGAMAMYGAFTFDTAWNRGELFLPWGDFLPTDTLNVPVRITLSDSGEWPMIPSLILALLMAAFIGAAAHFLIFRPLRNAAPLGKVVASVGLLLYLQGMALLNFGNSFPQPRSIVPDEVLQNFLGLDKPYPRANLYAIGFAILLGAFLWGLYRFTRFGLATRAAAGNEKGALLLGYNPQSLALVNWILASVTATLAVIIVGPIGGTLTPTGLSALIVPALAAALIGGLRSVPIAVAGGLALGAIQTTLRLNKDDWFSGPTEILRNGAPDLFVLIVIIAVLVLRGKSLPVRGAVEERRLPLAPNPQRIWEHALVWVTVITLLAFVFENAGTRTRFANSIQTGLVLGIVMLSIVVITGYVGQISLAQMSFAGVAAFVMARMMADGVGRGSNLVPVSGPGLPWPIAALIGVAAAVVIGVLLGLPALRIRGVQLAVVTISFAVALQSNFLENEYITQLRAGVPAFVREPTFFGADIGARSERAQNENPLFVLFAAITLALVAVAVANIRRTGVGRRFLSVRANERAAASAGINVARTKLLAFGIASGIAGLAGVMLGFKQVEVASQNFLYGISLTVLATAYLAGITSINGAIIGGVVLSAGALAPTFSNYMFHGTNIDSYLIPLTGVGIIVTAIIHPEGIAPFFQAAMRHAGNWICGAIPGALTIRNAYRGEKGVIAKVGLAIMVVGGAFFAYNAKFVEDVWVWLLIVAGVLFVANLVLATIIGGGLNPTFGQAGLAWVDWGKRFGPTALVGYVLGWLIWPIRVDTYSMLWMPILGAGLALFVRSIYRRIRYGEEPPPAPEDTTTEPPAPTDTTPTDEPALAGASSEAR